MATQLPKQANEASSEPDALTALWEELTPILAPLFTAEQLAVVRRVARLAFIAGEQSGIAEMVQAAEAAISKVTGNLRTALCIDLCSCAPDKAEPICPEHGWMTREVDGA